LGFTRLEPIKALFFAAVINGVMDESTPTRRIELLPRTTLANRVLECETRGRQRLAATAAKKSPGLVTGAVDEAHDAD
jgi:hypothetical protein